MRPHKLSPLEVCIETVFAFNVIALREGGEPLVVRAPPPWTVSLGHEGGYRTVCDDPVDVDALACWAPAD
jgi:hypothetical protein